MQLESSNLIRKVLIFQINRSVKLLYKSFLKEIEDLKASGINISDKEFDRIRKLILDNGNGTIRNLTEEVENLYENKDNKLQI